MGPSFDKIPEIELPPVLMTWKICLLKGRRTNDAITTKGRIVVVSSSSEKEAAARDDSAAAAALSKIRFDSHERR